MSDNLWNGFEIEEFEFEERLAKVVFPKTTPNGKLILKTEYFDAFPSFEVAMLEKGYTLCNIAHRNRWASSDEIDNMADFVRFVAKKYKLEEKCILVGMSCGGLQAARLAQEYPELVYVIYHDAPVLNILSMAGLGEAAFDAAFWRELVSVYGFSKSTIINFRQSPIDHMDKLIENDIPIIMLYGNADDVVIYDENGKVLENYYKEHGGKIKVIQKSMVKHHPHGLTDPTPIVNFVEQYA